MMEPGDGYGTIMVYTTWPSAVEAEAAGRAIVADGLAACVNIMPGMVSIYRWHGEIERAAEVVMILKTREDLADAVAQAVRARHSYDTPAILFLPVLGGDPDYLDWIAEETGE
ncbi:divalent-cation tolerance protein CutA [Ancylobacter pratisalsi]|uniref:Divalent-cation tolerance protein CutA n=1 Tax=Ancylobacter pratisalsi TaxID=1745854 RepID=A0A6P1YKU4_9HYPH|nr:divalent-cation tolerance protein CutA [Ancylobacter pratisalsi]QIB32404.1 divalent-cation tolerance protein CutA [Ancylobacter pratisalsi]